MQFGQVRYRLEIFIEGKAPDGMDLNRYYNFDWTDAKEQPTDEAVIAAEKTMRAELEALVKSPLVEPFAGPTMLTGRAAAVFFHEVFGHRDEGFRQKDMNEGQTFARKVGEPIMPDFISIVDDPTMKRLNKEMLLGFYPFDDEGVPSQRVTLVDQGVLKNFEMSRQPLKEFPVSNGHGRRQLGAQPVSRQGNLIVESSHKVSNAELRRMFIEEIKKQGKPFGLLIDDIAGGFTFTGRGQPQAFQVEPLVVYKVYADGRPDEMVRGVNIVGTPLLSLTKIVATGDTTEVFNGYCGAESGSVPVAAAAPSMLVSEMEVRRRKSSTDRAATSYRSRSWYRQEGNNETSIPLSLHANPVNVGRRRLILGAAILSAAFRCSHARATMAQRGCRPNSESHARRAGTFAQHADFQSAEAVFHPVSLAGSRRSHHHRILRRAYFQHHRAQPFNGVVSSRW